MIKREHKNTEQAIIVIVNHKLIDRLRRSYDPFYKTFKSHITLVYTFKKVEQKQLMKHLKDSIKSIKPFKITLNKINRSNLYLRLPVNTGRGKLMAIYKKLNSGVLAGFKNKEVRYVPHITIGLFKSKKQVNKAFNELKKQKIKINAKVDKISLLFLNKNHSIKKFKNFKLK